MRSPKSQKNAASAALVTKTASEVLMMNQIADAIKTFVDSYNEEKGFAMIIASQGDILPAPVVTGDPKLDITEDILTGLNAEYVKTKSEK